jgi:maltose alpha-D-glucosyltransferase/alpha-amylase
VNESTITSRVERAIASVSSDDLSTFLRRQRWFAAKASPSPSPRITSLIVLPWGDGRFAIAQVEVSIDAGSRQTYQLPIAARRSPSSHIPAGAAIGSATLDGATLSIYDAVYDADFRDGLARAAVHGLSVDGAGPSRFVVEPVLDKRIELPSSVSTRVIDAEQSNTSIVIGDRAILKLFRRVAPGPNPDVEVTRFLSTRSGFENTPALFAELRLEGEAGIATTGVVQALVPNAVDAWSYALDRGRPYFAAPADRDAPNSFVDDARQLGAVTRLMHEALAGDDSDPDFAPEDVTAEDLDRWAHRAQQSVRDSLALLETQLGTPGFPRDRLPEAQALVRRRDHYLGWINEIDDQLGDDLGLRTRTHGDFHLGQVLRSSDGTFMIIDFEGEPSRSLDERREKTSPLRDVAGMLRSFAYAAATLSQKEGKNAPPHVRELRIARWERDVRAAFLTGYLGASDEPGLLPDEDAHVRQLISLFETEKVFYELAYELNHRPTWAWIPLRGIAKLFVKS